MNASYTKLKDESWGIRVEGGTPKPGQSITVRKKSGETKTETVNRVLWSGNGVSLCSISATAGKTGTSSKGRTPGVCEKCGDRCNPKYRRCLECIDGGSRYNNGMSYYDSHGRFVLGDDD